MTSRTKLLSLQTHQMGRKELTERFEDLQDALLEAMTREQTVRERLEKAAWFDDDAGLKAEVTLRILNGEVTNEGT